MIGFRVILNGKRLVTAGLAGHHVLSTIVSSVVRDPARKATWTAEQDFVERQLVFSVTGLDSDHEQHVDWLTRDLAVGDRIEIQIIDANAFDEPVSRRPKRPSPKLVSSTRHKLKTARAPGSAALTPAPSARNKTKSRRRK